MMNRFMYTFSNAQIPNTAALSDPTNVVGTIANHRSAEHASRMRQMNDTVNVKTAEILQLRKLKEIREQKDHVEQRADGRQVERVEAARRTAALNGPAAILAQFRKRTGVTTLCNVFKYTYANDVKTTGFGDFIRGCYFLLQFCERFGFLCEFHVDDHPIRKLLSHFVIQSTHMFDEVQKLDGINGRLGKDETNTINYTIRENGDAKFATFLNEDCSKKSISHKTMGVHTIFFPTAPIDRAHTTIMRRVLAPLPRIDEMVDTQLRTLGLLNTPFSVIHLRLGDDLMNSGTRQRSVVNDAMRYILRCVRQWRVEKRSRTQSPILLLTDCGALKDSLAALCGEFPITFTRDDARHSAETSTTSKYDIINTMVEFYMMSHASRIQAFSVYTHGSGFSRWCATTYNIPYNCKYITLSSKPPSP